MISPRHTGLYFTADQIEHARHHRGRDPFESAWQFLAEYQPPDSLSAALLFGLRYRFDDDSEYGGEAAALVAESLMTAFDPDSSYLDTLMHTVALAQACELVRPLLDETEWGATFTDRVESLLVESDRADYSARAWLSTLHITSGIVLEDDSRLQTGTEIFRAIIDDIHPNGYIKPAVGAENEEPGDGEGFIAQMRVVKALVLGAEAATHAGTDLWAYHQRGVSPLTAATYLMFYYHHPEHWPWDKDLTADFTMPLYRLHSGLWEMVARHSDHRLLKGLLDDLRPIFDPTGGALTTLTHARIKKRRFGLF